MLCVECGQMNLPFSEQCQGCGRLLPERDVDPPVQTGSYDKLKDAAEKVRTRQISSGDFRDLLNKLETKFRGIIDKVDDIEMDEDVEEELEDEISVGMAGMKMYLQAIVEMHCYLETRDELYLDRGLMMALDANNRLNEALRMNWETFRGIQETTEEFVRTQSTI